MIGQFDNTNCLSKGQPHFRITSSDGKKPIYYCYIRKNACSAFKNLLMHQADGSKLNWPDAYEKFYTKFSEFEEEKTSLLVYRNPLERLISGYANKIIQQSGNGDVLNSMGLRNNVDLQQMTFANFINGYIEPCLSNKKVIDPHFAAQIDHLHPIKYTHCVDINELHGSMVTIIGKFLSDSFFKRASNDSKIQTRKGGQGIHAEWTVEKIHYFMQSDPSIELDLVTPELNDKIRCIYKKDFDLIDSIKSSCR